MQGVFPHINLLNGNKAICRKFVKIEMYAMNFKFVSFLFAYLRLEGDNGRQLFVSLSH